MNSGLSEWTLDNNASPAISGPVHSDVVQRAVAVNSQYLALGHEVIEDAAAAFVRNPALPQIHDANFIYAVTASTSAEPDRLLAQAALVYRHAVQVTFRIGPFTPPTVEARLVLEDFERTDALVLQLDGPMRRSPTPCDIWPVDDETAWNAYQELKCSVLAWRRLACAHSTRCCSMWRR